MFGRRFRIFEYSVAASCTLLVAMILTFGSAWSATVPKFTEYVNDYAGVLSGSDKAALNQKLVNLSKNTAAGNPQVVILIVPSLDGNDLDAFTNATFHQNKIGNKNNNNGVLTVLAMKEHRSRMEVGYDLEPVITDSVSKRILDSMIPSMRAGNVAKALNDETDQLIPLVISGSKQTQDLHGPAVVTNSTPSHSGLGFMSSLLLLIILGGIGYYIWKTFFKNKTTDTSTGYTPSSTYTPTPPVDNYSTTDNTYRQGAYRPNYTRPSYDPPSYTPPTYNPPAYTPPTPPASDAGSTLKSAAVGGLAGAAASSLFDRRKRDDDDSSSRSSSWGSSSSSDYGSSSSSSGSSDSGSSSSGSSDSGYSGGGGDSGGGGSDSGW